MESDPTPKSMQSEAIFVAAFMVVVFVAVAYQGKVDENNKKENLLIEERFNLKIDEYLQIKKDTSLLVPEVINKHHGKTVTIDKERRELHTTHFYKSERSNKGELMSAVGPEEAKTLIIVENQRKHLFSYSGGLKRSDGSLTSSVDVYRTDHKTIIIDLDSKEVLASKIFYGVNKDQYPDKATEFSFRGNSKLEGVGDDKRSIDVMVLYDSNREPYGITEQEHHESEIYSFVSELWNQQ